MAILSFFGALASLVYLSKGKKQKDLKEVILKQREIQKEKNEISNSVDASNLADLVDQSNKMYSGDGSGSERDSNSNKKK
jgi:hypothetical protein